MTRNTIRLALFAVSLVGFATLPQVVKAQSISITSANSSGAPSWTAWEFYYLYASGDCSGLYSDKIIWAYHDNLGDHEIASHTFMPGTTSRTDSYLQGTHYSPESQGGFYFIEVIGYNMMGNIVASATHGMTLTSP